MIRRLLIASAAALLPLAVIAGPAQAAPKPIVIWADATRAPVLQAKFADGFRGHPVTVVAKDLSANVAAIRDELKTVKAKDAPDVIWANAEWTGDLVASNLVVPVPMSSALKAQFATNVLAGYAYGGQNYGLPAQFENLALITNASLVPKPMQTFAALTKKALALKTKGAVDVGLAVGQGAAGNAYFMQPLFAGLGGYAFGTDATGSLNPADVGINNKKFRKNAPLIDQWNAKGLINSALDVKGAQAAFAGGRAAFWITGAWDRTTLSKLPFKYYISTVPNIVPGLVTSPYLGIKGFMVTSYAEPHGVLDDSLGLVRRGLSGAKIQGQIAALTERAPANTSATMGRMAQAFKVAGAQGVPSPNLPQESAIWAPLGKAWATSTKGADATPAKQAFATAQDEVLAKLG